MGKKQKKYGLAGTPAWAFSFLTLIGSIILGFILEGIGSTKIFNNSIFETIAPIFWFLLIVVACFFICKKHPKSVWYTPIICNGLIIAMAIGAFEWVYVIVFALSITAAIFGARIGRRIINQE